MNSRDNSVQTLAFGAQRTAAHQAGSCTELEERLTPLIRCVLRTGAGIPALVQWVRNTLPQLPSDDLDEAAPQMARLLSAEMIRQNQPETFIRRRLVAETIAGM